MPKAGRLMTRLQEQPFTTFVVFFVLSAFAFLPLLSIYGPSAWAGFPFGFQISRIGVYALWFSFGFLVGAPGFAEDSWPVVAGWRGTGRIGWLDAYWPITRYGLFPNGLCFIVSRLLVRGVYGHCYGC
jgi:hypothetical protein